MFVVGEGFPDRKPPHYEKRNVVDNSGVTGLATLIRRSCLQPLFVGGRDQLIARFEGIAQVTDILPERAARRGITAFQQDKCRCNCCPARSGRRCRETQASWLVFVMALR